MSESYFKDNEVTLIISATESTTLHKTGTTYFTFDRNVGKQIVNLKIRGADGVKDVDLNDVEAIKMYYQFTDAFAKHLSEEYTVIDANAGKFYFMLNNDRVDYAGEVLIYIYVVMKERTATGEVKSFEAGAIGTTYRESLIDADLPELEVLGWDRLDKLEAELRKHVDSIKAEMDRDLKTVKQDLTTAQSDINKIQSQIDDNDIVRQVELDSAGFGENNLIRNSAEPIIINPAGNLANAHETLHFNLDLSTTYTLTMGAEYLRGGSGRVMIMLQSGLSQTTSDRVEVRRWIADIENGVVNTTFTTPNTHVNNYLHLRVNAGTAASGNQGNTLKLTNMMLTIGTKPQPHRPAHEDNTERLDNVETLKPITKRTVATFEGKVAGSVVENPYVAHRIQTVTTIVAPNVPMTEFTQVNYDPIMHINNSNVRTTSTANENALVQHRFTFNIIEHLERNYSTTIWQGHTALADKVRIARQIAKRIACVWQGFGATNGTNGVRLRVANRLDQWHDGWTGATHSNSAPQRLTIEMAVQSQINWGILEDGTCRFLVHTAEGQTAPIGGATLTTEYVQFEVDVETTLASTDWSYSKAESDRQLLRYLPLAGGALTGGVTTSGAFTSTNSSVGFRLRDGNNNGFRLDLTSNGSNARIRLEGEEAGSFVIAGNTGNTRAEFSPTRLWLGTNLDVTGTISAPRLIGNADTATRLQTARNINGVPFDGTTNVSIDPPYHVIPAGTDLNTVTRNGFYQGQTTMINAPSGASGIFNLIFLQRAATSGRQEYISTAGRRWTRNYTGGVFGAWVELPTQSGNTVFDMTVTRATSLVTKSGKEIDVSDELTTCQNELQECKEHFQECKAEIAELKKMMLQIREKSE